MFYVSDITGALTPYTVKNLVAQQPRELLASPPPITQSETERLEFDEQEGSVGEAYSVAEERTVEGGSVAQQSLPATFNTPSSVGLGTAGAGALTRGTGESGFDRAEVPRSATRGARAGVLPVSATQRVSGNQSEGEREREARTVQPNPYDRLNDQPPVRERAIVAWQIMSKPVVTLRVHDTVEVAWNLFRAKRFRHVPVVSPQGKLVGILSDRDFLSLGLGRAGHELSRQEQLSRPLREIMTSNVLTTRPNTEIRIIAHTMFLERVSSMPVVDESGEIVGILTCNDILRTLVNKAPLELWT